MSKNPFYNEVIEKSLFEINVASLDKISDKEVCRFKADFDRLSVEGKISSETQAIMNSLFMIIELILLIFLSATQLYHA